MRVKQLEEELDRSHATTPALAEAAARSEVERLKRELAARQSELDAGAAAARRSLRAAPGARSRRGASWPAAAGRGRGAAAFGWDMRTLARRIRHKFGGIKVY